MSNSSMSNSGYIEAIFRSQSNYLRLKTNVYFEVAKPISGVNVLHTFPLYPGVMIGDYANRPYLSNL